jgi:hypothetical protein
MVTVLAHARVPSPESADEIDPSLVVGIGLRDALERVWPTDAHLTAYEPVELAALDADGNETGDTIPVRLTRSAIGEGIAPRMVAMIGDIDPPEHRAKQVWREETEAKLRASGLAWYSTRNGYRVIATIADPIVISSEADELQWYDIVLGWREYLIAQYDIEIDPKCKDWTRIMRLPNVQRDGQPARSDVRGIDAMPAWGFDQWITPPGDTKCTPAATRTDTPDDARTARARRIAERMPASIEGLGGDEALFVAANEVATQLGEDPAAIEGVLADTFNPRCQPPWPAAKLRYEAERAAARQATPEARHMRRADERRAEADARPRIDANDAGDPWARFASFTAPEEPIAYACEGLRLAPSKGKISVIAGQPGGGKGPIANHLAVCFALGLSAFGVHECRTSRVLLIDCEGSRLTMRRMRRMARGVGHDPSELDGRVLVVDASTIGDMTSDGNQDAIARIVEQHAIDVVILDSYTTAMLASGIESNSPQFALLAQMLGRLDKTVIAVAHANKASARDGEPRLSDIAYSGAFGALAQTAIVLHYPDDTDRHTIRVSCARAPETGFAPFDVRFADVAETDALTVAVVVRLVTPATTAAPAVAKHRATVEAAARHADRVEALLRDADTLGAGMPPRKICDALGLRKADWCEARAEALRRGTIVEDTLPSDRSVTVRLAGRNEVELGGVLPAVGSVASTRKRRSG